MTETTITDWQPAQAVWDAFCANHPALGLKGGRNSWIWFNRTHGEAMARAGVVRKTIKRHILLDSRRFARAAFDHLTNAAHEAGELVAA